MLSGNEWFFPAWKQLVATVVATPGAVVDVGTPRRFNKEMGYIRDYVRGEYYAFDVVPTPHIDGVSTGERLPFRSASLTGVLCSHVLEHVKRPEDLIAECRRVLADGGRAYFTLLDTWPAHGAPGWYDDYHRFKGDSVGLLFKEWSDVEVLAGGGLGQVAMNYLPHRVHPIVQRMVNVLDKRRVTTITPVRYVVATK